MAYESIMTLIPAVAVIAATAAALFIGYSAISCSVARMQGKECPAA